MTAYRATCPSCGNTEAEAFSAFCGMRVIGCPCVPKGRALMFSLELPSSIAATLRDRDPAGGRAS